MAAEASFGHAAADYAVGLGERAGARRVVLFHHKPDRTDAELDKLAGRLRRRARPGRPASSWPPSETSMSVRACERSRW